MLLVLLIVLVLPGVAIALWTRPFERHPTVAPLRGLVTATAVAAAAMLLVSLGGVWWVVEDGERGRTITTRAAESPLVLTIVAVGLLADAVVVTAVQGGRNWAPLALAAAWLMVGIGWFVSSGETVDSDAVGEPGGGLDLATWSTLLATIAAVLGCFSRLAERRAHAATRPGPRPR